MDIYAIRLQRLQWYVDKEGSIAVFARQHRLSETYISQLLRGHRRIGEKAARKIEAAIGLEPFTLDTLEADMLSPEQLEWLGIWDVLTEAQREAVRAIVRQFTQQTTTPSPPQQ